MKKHEAYFRIKELFAEIRSKRIRDKARKARDKSSWSRQRKMPLSDILICTLAKKGLSAIMELRHFFQAARKVGQTVSKQDYLKQRRKLNPEVFRELNRNYLGRFYGSEEPEEWLGYLVLAVDGSRAEIPDSPENRKAYGASRNQYGNAVARANISGLHDVLNGFMLDIGIHQYRDSEIKEAKANIKALKRIVGDRPVLILFDRNYASLEFMDFLEKAGVKYLIRLHKDDYKAEVGGMQGTDGEVELAYTKARLRELKKKEPKRAAELEGQGSGRVRIVKARLDSGEEAAFMTNLQEGACGDISGLYRKRWSIEKKYHTLKNKMKVESVTGKASIYVKQDFWAQMLVYNIVQDLIMEAEVRAAEEAKKKRLKYEVRINENIAIGLFKEKLIQVMTEEDDCLKDEMFRGLIADMEENIVPVRESKSAPRRWKYFNKYKCNQKPSF